MGAIERNWKKRANKV